jgi:hypothetical protein
MSDRFDIEDLIDSHAVAVDRHDTTLLATVWADGSRMVVDYGGTGLGTTAGYSFPEEIGRFIERLARFDRCLHCVTTRRIVVGSQTATGEVYCDAHYVTGAIDLHMAVRYDDRYARHGGHWRITERTVNVLWTSERAVNVSW